MVDPGRASADAFSSASVQWLTASDPASAVWRPGSALRRAARETALSLSWDSVLAGLEHTLLAIVRGETPAPVPPVGAIGALKG